MAHTSARTTRNIAQYAHEKPDAHGNFSRELRCTPTDVKLDTNPPNGLELSYLCLRAESPEERVKIWVRISSGSAERVLLAQANVFRFKAVASSDDQLELTHVELFRDGRWIPLVDAP